MKIWRGILILGLGLGVIVMCSPSADAAGRVRFYFGGEGAYSLTSLESGGYNTEGGFDNTGTDADNVFRGGAHLGLELAGILRMDLGFHLRGGLHYRTDSFVDVFDHFYYETDFSANAAIFSIYLSPFPDYALSPYLGAGVGGAMAKMETDDTVVGGDVDKTNLAWQVEAGIQVDISSNLVIWVGYRYLNLGSLEIMLENLDFGYDTGNFTGDVRAHEVVGGLRFVF